jgi:predicted metalloprotease
MALRVCLALLLLALAGAAACGGDERDSVRERVRTEVRERTERVRQRVERVRRRVEQVLGDIEAAVPRPQRTRPEVTRSDDGRGTIGGFLTGVLRSVDRYWTRTLTAAGRPEPRVAYVWVPAGGRVATGCGTPAGDDAAFYCPADDTIYVAERFALAIYEGAIRGLPGERAGGRAVGDFGVAYLVAHEYAHNVQAELGLFRLGRSNSSQPFELQADCMAGNWGAAVYAAGQLEPGDVEEAVSTALAVGDFEYGNANHHGTPEERRAAWLNGFRSGDPAACSRYVPT